MKRLKLSEQIILNEPVQTIKPNTVEIDLTIKKNIGWSG
jgi:hypothetical protein